MYVEGDFVWADPPEKVGRLRRLDRLKPVLLNVRIFAGREDSHMAIGGGRAASGDWRFEKPRTAASHPGVRY